MKNTHDGDVQGGLVARHGMANVISSLIAYAHEQGESAQTLADERAWNAWEFELRTLLTRMCGEKA